MQAAIATFALAAIWQLVNRVFAARPKLTWGVTNDNVFRVPWQPPATDQDPNPAVRNNFFYARNVWIFNGGTAVADEVEVAFNWKPEHLERFPVHPASEINSPDGRYILKIERLNPKEGMNFSLLSLNNDLPSLMHVRCRGFGAKRIEFINQRKYGKKILALSATLMLFGVFAILYLIIIGARFVFGSA